MTNGKKLTVKPSAFGSSGTSASRPVDTPQDETAPSSSKVHPFTPQLVRQAAATPPTLPKDATVTAFATRLPPDMQRMLKLACVERGIRMQDAVYEAIWKWLNS